MSNIQHNSNEQAKASECERILNRAFAMSALVCRGLTDGGVGNPDAESLHKNILDWSMQLQLGDHLSPNEWAIVQASLGSLTETQIIEASWAVEGLAILAWSLNLLDMPKHDEKVDPYQVTDALGFLSEDLKDIRSSAILRTDEELKACRELLYAIHSRLRDFLRNKNAVRFTTWIDLAWLEVLGIDLDSLVVSNDLAISGKPITSTEMDHLETCEWIIRERHKAIIWVIGEYPVYAETPVDT